MAFIFDPTLGDETVLPDACDHTMICLFYKIIQNAYVDIFSPNNHSPIQKTYYFRRSGINLLCDIVIDSGAWQKTQFFQDFFFPFYLPMYQ